MNPSLTIRLIAGLVLTVLLVTTTGCATATTLETWQHAFEHYIDDQGGGNLAAVRNLSTDRTHPQFGILGDTRGAVGPKRTDFNSVIVAHRQIGEDYWLVFLVGRIEQDGGIVDVTFDRPCVEELRPAAVSRRNGSYHWVIGEPDPSQLATYLAAQQRRWQQSHPDRAEEPIPFSHFPTEADSFRAAVEGGEITITEQRSGAMWMLQIPASSSPASPASDRADVAQQR